MSPGFIFLSGILLLVLFGIYFFTGSGRRKRIIGSVLTVLLIALSLAAIYPPSETVRLGLDLQGGTSFLLRLIPEGGREIRADTLEQAVEVIRKRVDQFGVSEPVITPQGKDRIMVQIAGLDPDKVVTARQQLSQVAKLEFCEVHKDSASLIAAIEAKQAHIPAGYRIESTPEGRGQGKLLIKIHPDIKGDRVSAAFPFLDTHGWGISLEFDAEGTREFARLTQEYVGRPFAIVLDGKVQSAPVIREAITGGRCSITGSFTEQEARDLASVLENPLQNPVQIEEERSVSAGLGADSIRSGIYAGLFGLAATFIFVMAYYRFVGVVAIFALVVNLVLLFGTMTLFNCVLTLPGIAGVILSIGMAIDANVLIYERLREEMAAGRPLKLAIRAAYDKAFSAIFDANLTSLITSVILFYYATGPVKGFAVTLTLGIVTSMFSALLVTRNCFAWVIETEIVRKIRMASLINKTKFDFLRTRKTMAFLCVVAMFASISVLVIRGERNFGVDFKGGDLIVLEAKETLTEGDVRKALAEIDQEDSTVQRERSTEREFISIRSDPGTSSTILKHLFERFPDQGLRLEQNDQVGKVVGDELARRSLIALGLGILGIFIYVAARFEVSFALATTVALIHDVILTVGIYAALGREISLVMIGAVLTVAGYSVNDTIVVFDRIREGLQNDPKMPLTEVMNESINDTLSRTILTGGTTIFTTLALYVFGGPVLNDFALVILIGLLAGTFSSVFLAPPIAYWWHTWSDRRRKATVTVAA